MGKRARRANRSRSSHKHRAKLSARRSQNEALPSRKQQLIAATEAHRGGDLSRAKLLYDELLERDPRDTDALHLAGVLHHQTGDNETALVLIEQAIALNGGTASSFSNLSKVLHDSREFSRAIDAARRALELDPQLLSAVTNLGFALLAYGSRVEAERHFLRVLEAQPGNLCVLTALARLYEQENRLAEAEQIVEQNLSRDPGNLGLSITAANLQRRQGDLQRAMGYLTETQRAEPAHRNSPHLHFELGRLHDQLGNYDQAFPAFQQAKSLQQQTGVRDEQRLSRVYEELQILQQVFTREWFRSWQTLPPPASDQSPVFVFGFPRSGNTLVDQILSSHSQLQTLIEKPMAEVAQQAVEQLVGRFPQALAELTAEQADQMRTTYFEVADQFMTRQAGLRLADTFPLNIQRIGFIHRLFPQAKLIFVLRHPCDVCLSCFMQNFSDRDVRQRFRSLDNVVDDYAQVMDLWQQYGQVLPLDLYTVRYEQLVQDLAGETRAICAHLDIPWEPAMCEFDAHARVRTEINTASYAQVTRGIYREARYRWLNYAQHLAPVLPRLATYAARYGYSLGMYDPCRPQVES